jgi:PadR family transcriptional regulator, regulatory protein PadR
MKTFPDCPCSGGTLDKLVQPAILTALTEGPIHGYRLAERIKDMTGRCADKPDVSGIYRCLKKMETTGLVSSSWESTGKGHPKRLFEITTDGRTCLVHWTTTLEIYLETITALLREAKVATTRKPKRLKITAK